MDEMTGHIGDGGQNVCFRHELKYRIDFTGYLELRNLLKPVMRPDPHADADGRYLIRSIYFDNYRDKALREKIAGAPKREKFRIRYYDDDLSLIVLEKKSKDCDLCRKMGERITEEECRQLLEGNLRQLKENTSPLMRELYAKMHCQVLRPRVLVSYIREPYIYEAGNVRVTFDSGVRTSLYHRDFLKGQTVDINAFDTPQDIILEVKYDAFLPEIIQNLIGTAALRQEAFSKYAACRRYG